MAMQRSAYRDMYMYIDLGKFSRQNKGRPSHYVCTCKAVTSSHIDHHTTPSPSLSLRHKMSRNTMMLMAW